MFSADLSHGQAISGRILAVACFKIYGSSARSTINALKIHTLFMLGLQVPGKSSCFNSVESLISCMFTVLSIKQKANPNAAC